MTDNVVPIRPDIDPICEGYGLASIDWNLHDKEGSHPFPWVTAITNADKTCFIRAQTGHDSKIDIQVTKLQAASLISILANFLAQP
jgi:hypothetical protein